MSITRGGERPGKARPRVQRLKLKLALFVLLCALPLVGSLQAWWQSAAAWPLLAYGLASGLGFWLYWWDKRQARSDGPRTPEKVLHGVELLGGWPGALLAQQLLRHKTRKLSYQLLFWLIVLVHQVFWIDRLFLGLSLASL